MTEFDREPLKPLARVNLDRVDQLHSLLFDQPEALETGLLILQRQIPTASGETIGLLGLDPRGRFVLIETKVGPDERLLDRMIDHYDWFTANLALFRRLFEREEPSGKLPPRGILIGPGFDPAVVRRIAYLGRLPLDLFEYRVYLKGSARFLSLDRVGTNRTEMAEVKEAGEGAAGKASTGVVELTQEEWREFEKFEKERNQKKKGENGDPSGPVEVKFEN